MSEDNLRRLLANLDEAADPSPAFRELLYSSLSADLRFATHAPGTGRGFLRRGRTFRLAMVLVALGLALLLAFAFAILSLKPTPQSACITGDFDPVRTAVAGARGYDYTTNGVIDTLGGSGSAGSQSIHVDGSYRAPDRIAITFPVRSPWVNTYDGGIPLQRIRWIGNVAYAVWDVHMADGSTPPPDSLRWNLMDEPWASDTLWPDLVSRPPSDPISFQLAGSTTRPPALAWSRWAEPPVVAGAACAFVAENHTSSLSTQTIRVWIDSTSRPLRIEEVRAGFRGLNGDARDEDLVTDLSFPANPTSIDPPRADELAPVWTPPPGLTLPPIFPRSPHVIQPGQTATLTDAQGTVDREVTAVELRELTVAEDGRAAPPGFVFMQLHLTIRALKDVADPQMLSNDVLASGGHYEIRPPMYMSGGPQPNLGPRSIMNSGDVMDGWIAVLVPASGDVRYRFMEERRGSASNEMIDVPALEIVLRP